MIRSKLAKHNFTFARSSSLSKAMHQIRERKEKEKRQCQKVEINKKQKTKY